ncbi:MAG: hypothetical protein CMG16_00165 [Candidatus Marinimicrobia bacterium]|nr:hypothetical protein [Candidatus Neomarinimicrobiota bacterium]|tara:strand:- start:141 stop:461 length:321 start_codon:yes stop_codon:yes gene_type:complete
MKKLKSFITYLSSLFYKETKNKEEDNQTNTHVFKEDDPLPNIEYMRMVELLVLHYKRSELLHGHLNFYEMRRRLSQLTHHEVKTLFDALLEIKITFKDYNTKNEKS